MTSRHSPERHYLAFAQWPAQDQSIWTKLTAPGATILDDHGAFAGSRPRTNAMRRQNYSHWLNHITLNHADLLPLTPAARICPDTLAGWLAILERTIAPCTRRMRAVDLLGVARAMDPDGDWRFLERAVRSVTARAVPSRNKEPRLRPSDELVELGLALMRKATTLSIRRRSRAATLYRDGLMIALLALRPMRLRNLAGLELGRTLHQGPAGWHITIPADETKTHRGIEAGWPPDLVDALAIYLARHRPVLLHGSAVKALWVSTAGRALAEHSIRQTIIARTQAAFGVSITPHLFRDCAATTLAIEDRHMLERPRPSSATPPAAPPTNTTFRPTPWQPVAAIWPPSQLDGGSRQNACRDHVLATAVNVACRKIVAARD
jgi:integrase/recombinase XerD